MLEWLIAHRKSIINYGFGAFALLIAAYSFYSRVRPHPEADYIAAQTHYQKWTAGNHHDRELFQKLEKSLDKHPELHAQYDALIAERLLIWNEPGDASRYLLSALKRVEGSSLFYPEFARTTLLISQGELKEALSAAVELKEEMAGDATLFSTQERVHWEGLLYAFNLVRIGMLEKAVGSPEGERAAWQELIALQEKDPEAFNMLQYHFRTDSLSLFDYIQHREALLVN